MEAFLTAPIGLAAISEECEKMEKKSHKWIPLLYLHLLLVIYSLSSILSKRAGLEQFLSWKFCLYYGGMIGILGFYAIAWQQILRKLPLVTAYANKAVTVIWGLVWGALFFDEQITLPKILGCLIIMAGVYFVALDEEA